MIVAESSVGRDLLWLRIIVEAVSFRVDKGTERARCKKQQEQAV